MNLLHLDTIAKLKLSPPIAARNLAISHIAMDDAQQKALKSSTCRADLGYTAAIAFYTVLVQLYPQLTFTKPTGASTTCAKLGNDTAMAILLDRKDDISIGNVSYTVLPKPSWQPSDSNPALLPGWGNVKPFKIARASAYDLGQPPTVGSATYLKAFNETLVYGGVNSTVRTPAQTLLVKFWGSGSGTYTPSGLWNLIAQNLTVNANFSYKQNLKLFRMLNEAMADAVIVAWMHSYKYKTWRPITAIRDSEDPKWQPLSTTPTFPEYISPHSTLSGAAGKILIKCFGDVPIIVNNYFGNSAKFSTITAAVSSAGKSRIHGGVHFEFSNSVAIQNGNRIASEVYVKSLIEELE
jgi:hypothetical protein